MMFEPVTIISDVHSAQSVVQLFLLLLFYMVSIGVSLPFFFFFPLQVCLPAFNVLLGFLCLRWGIFCRSPQLCLMFLGFCMGVACWEPSLFTYALCIVLVWSLHWISFPLSVFWCVSWSCLPLCSRHRNLAVLLYLQLLLCFWGRGYTLLLFHFKEFP